MGVFNVATGRASFAAAGGESSRAELSEERSSLGVWLAMALDDGLERFRSGVRALVEVMTGVDGARAPRHERRPPVARAGKTMKGDAPAWLVELSRSQAGQHRLVIRAQMVMGVLFERRSVAAVARALGTTRDTVRLWVGRYLENGEKLSLEDRIRTGRPPRLGVKDTAVVVSLACQRVEALEGCVEGRLTQRLITALAEEQGVLLSRSSTQRILAGVPVKAHRNRYFLFTPKDRPDYIPRRDAICDLYTCELAPDEVAYCVDEKPSIQALERIHPGKGAAPGRPPLTEFEYRRHGTVTLVAALNVATGELTHHETAGRWVSADMVAFLRRLLGKTPDSIRKVHLVWDNGTTHVSKETKAFLASPEGSRLVLHYTPTHASWLNQAEMFFSLFSRRYLRGRSYSSRIHLVRHIELAAADYTRWAKPMRWKFDPAKTVGSDIKAVAA